jgi:hypothetical protein
MTLYGRSSRWAAALALGLAGLIGVGAATVLAAPARSAATEFELTFEGTWEWNNVYFFGPFRGGTFKSRAPFCAAGTFVEDPWSSAGTTWRFTCDDGTGGLTVSILDPGFYLAWQSVDGSGSYAGFRGGVSLRDGEILGGPSYAPGSLVTWRGTLGVVDWGAEPDQSEDGDTVAPTKPDQPEDADTVAPTIAIASARAAKLLRPAGAYSINVSLALRDDVEGNPVSYRLRVATARGIELTRRFGTATKGAFSMTLRIRPPDGARFVRLQLTGVDPVGNAVSVRRALSLPR